METDVKAEFIPVRLGAGTDFSKSRVNVSLTGFQLVVFIFGVGLLAFFVYYTGIQTIAGTVRKIGWGLLVILGLNGSRHLLRALSVYVAIPPEERKFGYHNIVATRLGGDAVGILSFTGPLLGEATKATLLKRWMPFSHAVAAVFIDNIIYDMSVALVILSGVSLLFYTHTISNISVVYGILGTTIFALTSVFGLTLLIRRQAKPFAWLIGKFGQNKYFPKLLVSKKTKILTVEDNIFSFYFRRRSSFFAILVINFLAHALSVTEVYLALYFLGFSPEITNAFIIESLTKVINLVFGFVPGTIGVYEGGNVVILHTLGFTTATGVVLGLTRKGAIIFWTMVGLLILIWKGVFRIKNGTPDVD